MSSIFPTYQLAGNCEMLIFGALAGLILNNKLKIKIPAFLLILLLAWSCQKDPAIRVGFNTEFDKYSQGLYIMNVSNESQVISLKGNVIITEGQILVELINSEGDTVFTRHLLSPNSLNVNESFLAIPGNWKLKYKSMEGIGSLSIYLNIAD